MVWLENQYGEKVVELVNNGDFWELPSGFRLNYLAPGDIYKVVSDEESAPEATESNLSRNIDR